MSTFYPERANRTGEDAYNFDVGAQFSVAEGVGGGGSVLEPASWAMMLGGFALAGAAMRGTRTRALT